MRAPFTSYTVQCWQGDVCQTTIDGLSIDAARYLAQVHASLGDTGRVLAEGHDYAEVWTPAGDVRRGPLASITDDDDAPTRDADRATDLDLSDVEEAR